MQEAFNNAEGAARTADALLRANGGRDVLLRVPAPPVAGSQAEELGLATPQFNDIVLGPAVFRKANSTATLLVSAAAMNAAAGTLAFDSVDVLLQAAAGIVIDDVLYTITEAVTERMHGKPFCYAIPLRAPAW